MRRRGLLALAAVAALWLPAHAAASSIVYLDAGGNVNVIAPDGDRNWQLTEGIEFESPSQADDGTVFAVERGEQGGLKQGFIHRLNREGEQLADPVRCGPLNSTTYIGPLAAEVSRDGGLMAFHYFRSPEEDALVGYCPTDRDALTTEFGEIGGHYNPSWIAADRVVMFARENFPNVITDRPGPAPEFASEGWFTDEGVRLTQGAVDRGFTKLAAVASGGAYLVLYELAGPPPALPVAARCNFSGSTYGNPTWSPDGTQLAWDEPDGIHVADVPSLADCGQISQDLLVEGSDPHWGPVDSPRFCVVPRLKGKTLANAKRALKLSDCRLGQVTRKKVKRGKAGRVLSQRPKPNRILDRGTKVHVVVSRRN